MQLHYLIGGADAGVRREASTLIGPRVAREPLFAHMWKLCNRHTLDPNREARARRQPIYTHTAVAPWRSCYCPALSRSR